MRINKPTLTIIGRSLPSLAAGLVLAAGSCTVYAYPDYTGCSSCHGDFRGPVSPKGTVFPGGQKHEMHRSSSAMATDCNLCHNGTTRTPV